MSGLEERMLSGEFGRASEKSMRLLVSLGEAFGAESLVPVERAQISGVSYKNIGDSGLEYLEDIAKLQGKVSVKATLNPAGMDISNWKEMRVPEDFAQKQIRVLKAYKTMGVTPTCTCTPYLADNIPRSGQHIAWAESSAVIFANSVIGAYTNREGGPSALASALTGRTPLCGLHLEDEREPTHLVNVETNLETTTDYSLLGYYVGRVLGKGVPFFKNLTTTNWDDLKALSASLSTSGGIAMFTLRETSTKTAPEKLEKIVFDKTALNSTADLFSQDYENTDLVCVGCPHCSSLELGDVSRLLEGRTLKKGIDFWVCVSHFVKKKTVTPRIASKFKKAGVRIVSDTCLVGAPLKDMGYKNIATNSCKAAHYLSSSFNIGLRTLDECLKLFTTPS